MVSSRGWLRWAVFGWMLLVGGLEVAIRTPVRHWGIMPILDVLHPWWYAPALPFALLGVLLQRRWVLPLMLLALVWIASYGSRWFPVPPSTVADATLRVLTWNVAGWNLDAADLDRVISAENPAIIALQEVDEGLRRPLIQRWSTRYPFYEIRLPTEPGLQPADLVLFSRYPYTTSPLDCPYWRCYRRAVVLDVAGRALTFVNVHIERSSLPTWDNLGIAFPYQLSTTRESRTVERLLADTAGWSGALLIVGDFNTTERQASYPLLAARWRDTWRERGRGLGMTWPRTALTPPLIRIDYIWHSDHLITQDVSVGAGRSDHRYLVADFSWR